MIRVLVALVALLVPVLPGQVRAQTLPVDQSVEVAVTTLRPLNPQPGKTLRLTGRLRNRGEQDITALQVRLLLSGTPMATRSEIGVVSAGGADRDGPPTLAVSEPITALAPRSSVDWSVRIPLDDLPLSLQGVYVIGLEVIGTGADGLVQRFGLTRTFLPWFGKGSVQPTRFAWLWPLTAKPDRALDGVQLNEQTAAEMADGGRLARLLDTARDTAVTRVIDPALLQTADEMSSGYEVVSGPGLTTTGEGSGVAASWLDDAEESAADGPTVTTPYAMPDAVALERADMAETTVLATARAAEDATALTQTEVDEVLAWPAGQTVTPGALRSYVRGGARAVLLSDTAMPPSPALTYTPDGFTTWANTQVVLSDGGLSAALAMPQDSRADALMARQRFLAELAMTAGELPDDSRSIVAAPDPLWNPRSSFVRQTLRAVREVPYARLVPLETAARRAVEVARVRIPYGPEQRGNELPKPYMTAVSAQQGAARRFAAILTEPSGLAYEQAVARQTSALWRTDLMAGNALVATVSQQLATQTAAVRVATTGTFTLPGDSGRIPVTVANDLDQDVVVGIRLESDQPARLTSEPIEAFEVPAGRKVSQEVEALVAGSGSLPVKIQLVTPAGKPYGQPVTVQVRTTAYSQAAAYVVSGAFVILAFLLGMNFVRRRHVHRKEHPHE